MVEFGVDAIYIVSIVEYYSIIVSFSSSLSFPYIALSHSIQLYKLPSQVSVGVIDGHPITSGDIVEELEPICVVLDNLANVISFNIISSLEHSLVLGLPWFELHNPTIDWRKRMIEEVIVQFGSLKTPTREMRLHKISTIFVQQLREEGLKEDMLVFAILATPSSSSQELGSNYRQSIQNSPMCSIR